MSGLALREQWEGKPIVPEDRRYHCPAPDLTKYTKSGRAREVTFPVSIYYNGGTVIDGKWYSGYEVPAPIVPPGWKLVDIGVGFESNAHPPRCTMKLVPDSQIGR